MIPSNFPSGSKSWSRVCRTEMRSLKAEFNLRFSLASSVLMAEGSIPTTWACGRR